MNRIFTILAALVAAVVLASQPAAAQPAGFNGSGTCTRPANTTSYGAGPQTKLFGCLVAAATAASQVIVRDTVAGANLVIAARISTTGTGAATAGYQVYLYGALPTLTALSDQSTYVGPYAADLPSFIGTFSCGAPVTSMNPTGDVSPQYWVDCAVDFSHSMRFAGGSPATAMFAVIEVTSGYVPISSEVLTLGLMTARYEN